ncbi:hypothetical protein BDV3_004581 [Batrachochytrium dendrobatidis]
MRNSISNHFKSMGIKFLLLVSRQGKIRLTKWFTSDWGIKEKTKIVRDVSQMVLARKAKMCNVLEFKDFKVVYRRYASLFFVVGTDVNENELLTLEQAYTIIDELLIGGELQDSSKRAVLNTLKRIDEAERQEAMERI